jgi:membrane protein
MRHLDHLSNRLDGLLWDTDLTLLPAWQGHLLLATRMAFAIARDLTQGYLSLQAMSLVYTTLLSLVPLLAVSFSVLKGFGAHNELEPLLLNALAPLGEPGHEISARIIEFVDNMKVGVLGSVGLVGLLYTVISLIQKIEQVFNYTWRVDRARTFANRFSQYLSVLLIGPVLLFSALAVTASIGHHPYVQTILAIEPLSRLVELSSRLAPYVLISLAFAFVYVFVPNTRVHLKSALIGALVAGALWQGVGWLFTKFMVVSTQYAAIYSSLAILVLFMIWIYVAWLILLVGASVAFYHQHPEFLDTPGHDPRLSNRMKERLGLLAAGYIARSHYLGDPPWCTETLSKALHCPGTTMERVLGILERGGFVLRTAEDPPRFLPSKAPEGVPLKALFDLVRCCEETGRGCRDLKPHAGIREIERSVDEAVARALDGRTLRDLAETLATDPSAAAPGGVQRGGLGPRTAEPR